MEEKQRAIQQQGRKKQNSKVIMQQKRHRRRTLTFWRITKYGANSFIRNAWLSVAATAVMTVTLVIIFGSLLARSILMDTVDDIKNKVGEKKICKSSITIAKPRVVIAAFPGTNSEYVDLSEKRCFKF